MADLADIAQEVIENRLEGYIAKARAAVPRFDWTGSCYCGEEEGDTAPHFCGVFCRDLYEREMKQRAIRGRQDETDA